MDSTEVIIVGAGPAGLALGVFLSKLKVHSVILEKELEITEDPRGVAIIHDAVRICWHLGLGEGMDRIGHEMRHSYVHQTSFANTPFFTLDMRADDLAQALPSGILQLQPMLEQAMCERIAESKFCKLRRGCTVTGHKQEGTNVVVEYTDSDGESKCIHGAWLIGADGKRGIVRKHFLEPTAGIRQVDSSSYYKYDETWIAANIKISLPTPSTHPTFPLWDLGYTPEEVYDLFWPDGWHFGCPPGKPMAAGRFGPHESRLWRHEFAQDDWDEKTMDAEQLLWDHLVHMITLKHDRRAGRSLSFQSGEVTYPRDCIQVQRCRPYRFTHKVVNQWFHERTILIGDAAHVFPPFGGQGIASGLRDAQQLAWRLFLLQRLPPSVSPPPSSSSHDGAQLLASWARERVYSVKLAAAMTRLNGRLCNEGDSWKFWVWRNLDWALRQIQSFLSDALLLPRRRSPLAEREAFGFKSVEGGFCASGLGGGGRLPQVYLSSSSSSSSSSVPILSDSVLGSQDTAMTLIVLLRAASSDQDGSEIDDAPVTAAAARTAIEKSGIHESVLGYDSIRMVARKPPCATASPRDSEVYFYPTPVEDLLRAGIPTRPLYAPSNLFSRLHPETQFVVLRADFFIYGQAKNTSELVECLVHLHQRLSLDVI